MSDDENVHYLPPSEEILMESERRAEEKWAKDPPWTAWQAGVHWTVLAASAIIAFLLFGVVVAALYRLMTLLWP